MKGIIPGWCSRIEEKSSFNDEPTVGSSCSPTSSTPSTKDSPTIAQDPVPGKDVKEGMNEASSLEDISFKPSALIRWTRTKFCPECGKYKVGDTKEDMISACDKMWRKYMRLSDSHCPLWTQCRVKVIDGSDKEVSLWERMPRIIGRS
ncbi:hypothetical protein FOZ61_008755 [Perkinsus olseni]|uniref:Uncharacterized protein n=1 Tax=Perkinsus olseni TaxID=32597 RepID=A0A7J6L3B9_PEROL|nr:hypothetical protein FOZ61_008755 [Perkinsus olseni]